MPTTKHRIAANLTEEEFSDLAALAREYDVSLAWVGRQAVLEFIERHRLDQLTLPLGLDRRRLMNVRRKAESAG